ncbi:hypothetical protein V6Z11_A02G077400 [Gossypium hirsutum]
MGIAITPPISSLRCSFQSRNSPAASPSSYRRNPSCLKSLLTVHSPRLDSPPPRWVHLAHGLLLFLYQTFDAVDGKQARRTNSSSPLGELFDHGCDALASTFETMDFGSTAMCGGDSFWFWVILSIPFYGATWEHYFTNALILPIVNGPTEQLLVCFLTRCYGGAFDSAQWWAQPFQQSIPFLSWIPYVNELPTYKAAVYLLTPIAILPTVACNISNVHKIVKARKGNMLLALAMLYPFVVLMGGVLICGFGATKSDE